MKNNNNIYNTIEVLKNKIVSRNKLSRDIQHKMLNGQFKENSEFDNLYQNIVLNLNESRERFLEGIVNNDLNQIEGFLYFLNESRRTVVNYISKNKDFKDEMDQMRKDKLGQYYMNEYYDLNKLGDFGYKVNMKKLGKEMRRITKLTSTHSLYNEIEDLVSDNNLDIVNKVSNFKKENKNGK